MKEIRVTAKKYDYYRQELKEIKQAKIIFQFLQEIRAEKHKYKKYEL